ncbi:Uma2 family endonuclease [Spirulina subsalsa FACHB-351]|uniref:Uma2 family endonuclease n=1 Tax=Spirulina subsalsa FACHB-351 TaxID=234711 RepID=A0ABT3L471_9CYAN|nr:Uma2 family endonuclease [Spirulina subsalsa]MCW6036311.1 Uma2 family endonuclease [Spirulina subsalsa FACHB-351]
MVTASQPNPNVIEGHYTPEEYLSLEERADFKSEYHDGVIIPMTGATTNHNHIALNLSIALRLGLKGQNYNIFMGDVRLWIPKTKRYTYPDVMVISGSPQYYKTRKDTVTNPQVLVEVLSQGTSAYDRGDKFSYYKTIASFQEYLLIHQSQPYIEQYFRTGNKRWIYSEYDGDDETVKMQSFSLDISLTDLYENVDFQTGGADAP